MSEELEIPSYISEAHDDGIPRDSVAEEFSMNYSAESPTYTVAEVSPPPISAIHDRIAKLSYSQSSRKSRILLDQRISNASTAESLSKFL